MMKKLHFYVLYCFIECLVQLENTGTSVGVVCPNFLHLYDLIICEVKTSERVNLDHLLEGLELFCDLP